MARKPKVIHQTAQTVAGSEGFRDIIRTLEKIHPIKKGLGPEATMEQRAMKQVSIQEYEQVLIYLRKLSDDARALNTPSTYEPTAK